jgi:tetratricopeptide (TPR) repeat protein
MVERPQLIEQARAARASDRLDEAADCYARAAALSRLRGDAVGLAHDLRHLGDVWLDAGDLTAAEPVLEEALQLYRAHAGLGGLELANAIRPLALVRARVGGDARALLDEAIALYGEAGIAAGVRELAKVRDGLAPG